MALVEVRSVISGSVWKIETRAGQKVAEDTPIMILESMKMEIPLMAPEDGTIREIHVGEGQTISEGELVATLET